VGEPKAVVKQMLDMNQQPPWKVPEAFIWDAVKTTGLAWF